MTREEAIENIKLMRFNAAITNANSFKEALDMAIEALSQPSLPSNLDEVVAEIRMPISYDSIEVDCYGGSEPIYSQEQMREMFKAGAEWMAGQGWIDDGSMPPETKQEGDTLQGHREWTESEPVLAWDSVYGCCVDWTRNGKWVLSEQKGGYAGQICHGIIAWRPIPKYKEKQ